MILRLPRNFIFPLTLLAFIGITVDYANIVFTTDTRWLFLSMLVLYLLAKWRFLFGFQSPFGVAVLIYCVWCISTSTWSEVPQLSIEKSLAFSLVGLAFVSASHEWIYDRGFARGLVCLGPITAIALFAGSGWAGSAAAVGTLSTGFTSNANMLGSLIFMALPLLLWSAYKYRRTPRTRWIFFVLVVIALEMLIRTYSRSAMLSAGALAIGFCLSLKLRRTGFILVLIGGALLLAAALGTALVDTTYDDYILKGGSRSEGVFYSRQFVWDQTYKGAVAGAWSGIGYGASVGDTVFNGGLSAVGYGREKGNTQLAIIEETGLVGLGLYVFLLGTLFTTLVLAHRREQDSDRKVMLGIITGALAGLTLMSVFEAWWVAPGSAESAYFWSLAGLGLGIARFSRHPLGVPVFQRVTLNRTFMPARQSLQRTARG